MHTSHKISVDFEWGDGIGFWETIGNFFKASYPVNYFLVELNKEESGRLSEVLDQLYGTGIENPCKTLENSKPSQYTMSVLTGKAMTDFFNCSFFIFSPGSYDYTTWVQETYEGNKNFRLKLYGEGKIGRREERVFYIWCRLV